MDDNRFRIKTFLAEYAAPDFPNAACVGHDPNMWVMRQDTTVNDRAREICRGTISRKPCPHLAECTGWACGLVGTTEELSGVILGNYESPSEKSKKEKPRDLREFPIRRCKHPFCNREFISTTKLYCTETCRRSANYLKTQPRSNFCRRGHNLTIAKNVGHRNDNGKPYCKQCKTMMERQRKGRVA